MHPLVVVRREPLGALRRGRAPTSSRTTRSTATSSRAGCGSRSTRSATPATRDAAAATTCSGCSPTCGRRSRTGRRCASRRSASPTSWPARQLPVPDKDITDSVELLRWLADDHFTFLGYREYRLADGDDGEQLLRGGARHRPGHPARRPDRTPRVLSSMTPGGVREGAGEAAADHHQGQLAGHRAPLGLPGLHRLQGLRRRPATWSASGASSACSPSPRTAPACASCRWSGARWPRCWTAPGCRPRSHSGKDLHGDPGDLPARRAVPDRAPTSCTSAVIGVLRMAGRRQLRLFLRRDAYGRFISCLVYLPRDRFTTANRLRMQEILLRELNGVGVDYTTRVTESHAGPGALHRAHRPGQPARRDRRRRAGRAARRRHPAVGRRLPPGAGAQARRGAGQGRCSTGTPTRCPESYKDEHTPYEAVQGRRQAGAARGARPAGDAPVPQAPATTPNVRFKVYRYGEPMMLSAVLPVLHSLGVRVDRRAAVRGQPRRRHGLPVRLRPAAAGRRTASWPRCARRWRTRSRPPGAARPRSTGSTSWCSRPG